MSDFPYNTRTSRVEGSCFTSYFFAAVKSGVAELNDDHITMLYRPAGKPVFSAEKIQKAAAVFDSRPIVLSSDVTSWKSMTWSSSVPVGSKIHVYVKTAQTETEMATTAWVGPLMNGSGEDISFLSGRILQFRVVMAAGYDPATGLASVPSMSECSASCYVKGTSQVFYTKVLSLDFVPTHVILTYNGTIPTDAILSFAVATVDSTKPVDYKTIQPNTVEGIEEIAKSKLLKVCVSALGNTEIPFTVDEFALTVSGDSFTKIVQ